MSRFLSGLLVVALVYGGGGSISVAASGRTFFVSASAGDDGNDGLSPRSPWRTLRKVDTVELKPGDNVLFRRGDAWRDTLIPQNGYQGAPITYGAYGQGDKPLLLGSVSRNEPGDWHPEGVNLWATAKPTFAEVEPPADFAASPWFVHAEGGAKVKITPISAETKGTRSALQIDCTESGAAPTTFSLATGGCTWSTAIASSLPSRKCSKPLTMSQIVLMKQSAPWTQYGKDNAPQLEVGPNWTDCVVRFKVTQAADDGRITIFLGGTLPKDSVFSFQPVSWRRLRRDAAELSIDVGNILFDHGKAVGVKKWKLADVKRQGDYCYCGDTWQVKLYSSRNPAQLYRSIELALRRHIIGQNNKGHVVYENLASATAPRTALAAPTRTTSSFATATLRGSAAATSARGRMGFRSVTATASSSGTAPTTTSWKAVASGRCTTPP